MMDFSRGFAHGEIGGSHGLLKEDPVFLDRGLPLFSGPKIDAWVSGKDWKSFGCDQSHLGCPATAGGKDSDYPVSMANVTGRAVSICLYVCSIPSVAVFSY